MDVQKLRARVAGILVNPRSEWRAIAAEPADVRTVYLGYIVPLAAIPAAAMFVGLTIGAARFSGRFPIGTALYSAVVLYLSTLAAPIVAAVVIERMAPKFKSAGSLADALKLVAYASTPMWVAGVLYVFLYLAPLVFGAALYSVYVFYLGLPPTMKTPPDHVVPYMVVSAIALLLINMLLASFRTMSGMPSYGF